MFGASTFDVIDGEWCIVQNGVVELSLADSRHVAVFMPRRGEWHRVYVGRVCRWDGEVSSPGFAGTQGEPAHYAGLVVSAPDRAHAYCPAPHLKGDDWAAYDRQSHECWVIEPHATVKTTDIVWFDHWPLQPSGHFVCRVARNPPSIPDEFLGMVAIDLEHLPFDPCEYEVRDGAFFSTNRLVLEIRVPETEMLWGEMTVDQTYAAEFWTD